MTGVLDPTTSALDLGTERPPMVAALSPSSIATWKQCPRRFFYEKILRLPTEAGLEAVCGSFVHEVLEHLMGLPSSERTSDSARAIATQRWPTFSAEAESRFTELGLDEVATKDFKRRAWAGITGYFAIEDPSRIDVVATEQEVQAEFNGAPLYGIVDRLERRGDQLVLSDYKTGKAPKWPEEIDEKLEQLRLYAAMLDAAGTPVSTLRLLFLSPQLGAAAKSARAADASTLAMVTLRGALPEPDQARPLVDRVEAAYREARAQAGPDDDKAVIGRDAAVTSALAAATETVDADTAHALAQLILDAVTTRRRAFFARREADQARPGEIVLDVEPHHIASARAEVLAIWEEATRCYDAWDFPTRAGVLCDWCPFTDMCDGYAAWVDAGRPTPTAA